MSGFFDETMKGLQQAEEISRGTLPVASVNGLPAETYRATEVQDEVLIRKLQDRLESVPDAYPDFVTGIIHYARKRPERMNSVMEYLGEHPDALSSDVVRFVSDQPDFMEDNK